MITEDQAVDLLKKYSADETSFEKVFSHSKKVQEIALKISEQIEASDDEFVKIGALLHDIGRFSCPPGKDRVRHGIIGADILRKEGLPEFAMVAERHIGVGISKEDIEKQGLDLPSQDYIPVTVEEKIICYADNLVFGDKEGTLDDVKNRFRRELGDDYVKRVEDLHLELEKFIKNK